MRNNRKVTAIIPSVFLYVKPGSAAAVNPDGDVESQVVEEVERVKTTTTTLTTEPFQTYLTFMYYACISPFKPVYNQDTGCWTLGKSKVQRTLSTLQWIGHIIFLVTCIHRADVNYDIDWSRRSSKTYFKSVRMILDHFHLLLFGWALASSEGQNHILRLLNSIQAYNKSPGRRRPVSTRWNNECLIRAGVWAGILLSIVTTTVTIVCVSSNFGQGWFQIQVELARERFYQPKVVVVPAVPKEEGSPFSDSDIALTVASMLLQGLFFLYYFSSGMMFWLATSITLRIGVTNFVSFVESVVVTSSQKASITENEETVGAAAAELMIMQGLIIEEFYKLKSLVNSVNNTAVSALLTLCMVEFELDVIFSFPKLAESGNPWHITFLFLNVSHMLVSLLTCAEMQRQICCFKLWLGSRECRRRLGGCCCCDEQSWVTQVRQVERAWVGIGIEGMYQISYCFLAQVLAVTITLFIVSFE